MTYSIISTKSAARGKTYYKVQISDSECRHFKFDSDLSQDEVDVLVAAVLQREQKVKDDEAEFQRLIDEGIIEDPNFPQLEES